MDDLVVPTPGRVAEDSFRAAAPDGVPVRDVELEEAAVAAFGLSGLVGDRAMLEGRDLTGLGLGALILFRRAAVGSVEMEDGL